MTTKKLIFLIDQSKLKKINIPDPGKFNVFLTGLPNGLEDFTVSIIKKG